MSTELIVAEKPKVAAKIAQAIGENIKHHRVGSVSYYEGTTDGKHIFVAPAVGHIYSLAEIEKTSTYPTFDIEWKPAYEVDKDAGYTKGYVQLLEKLGEKADEFICACDFDIEGSLIGANVLRFAVGKKEARRMKFSAVTHTDLQEAYETMGEMDYNNAYAGEARHILDWYFGINLSRALMSALKAAERWKVMSIGRVQGPSLELLAALEKQIAAFVPTPYWELNAFIKGIEFKHAKGRFLDEKEAKRALDNTKSQGKVTKVEKKENLLYPYPPFDLTSLQVEAYRVFGYAPTRTLDIAQRLYEDSYITYPRTSSQQFPPTIKLPAIIRKLGEQEKYAHAARYLIDNSMFKPMQGKKTDPAHPAIHPTGLAPEGVHEQEMKLYDLIVKRFLALFAPAAKREKTNLEVDAGELYVADGMRIVEKGWTEFYAPYYKGEDIELPRFDESEQVAVENKKKHKKETKPPNRYTEASIISELEDRKLGTKSTRATIVETLFKRHYIHGKSIKVTDLGIKVVEVLEKYAPEILDEQLTRKIEDDMEKIQEGSMTKEAVIQEGKEILIQTLDKWKKHEEKIGKALYEALKASEEKQSTIGACDKCKTGNLKIIRMKQGKQFIGCSSYPDCNNAYPLPGYAYITVMEKPCEHCSKPMINVRRAKMRSFNMCIDPKCPSKAGWGKKKEEKKEEEKA
ncbi:DNA topoisomerase I [Candidatus Micrarchaeota archaeon]|nr:DNA topoisomerase I [Candidatus Micrarchaeota archaeon]